MGKGHIKLTVTQEKDLSSEVSNSTPVQMKAIAWRWREYFPLPPRIDIAYRLRENTWNGNTNIELELIGVRLPNQPQILFPLIRTTAIIPFEYKQRRYTCGVFPIDNSLELRIKNTEGKVLAIESGNFTGLLGNSRKDATQIDIFQPHYYDLVRAAIQALETAKKPICD